MATIIETFLSDEETKALQAIVKYMTEQERADYAACTPAERPNHIYSSVLTLAACGWFFPPVVDIAEVVITPLARKLVRDSSQHLWEFLTPHRYGDWGDICTADWLDNDAALSSSGRLFSSYKTKNGEQLSVITEADRSVTTVLLPSED